MAEELRSLEYTPTWAISVVCFIIVLISLMAERGLHHLGKCLKHRGLDALYEALQKLKEELMLLGFISLLLTVSQGPISNMCISIHLASIMLPCKLPHESTPATEHFSYNQAINNGRRRLLSEGNESQYCAHKGKVPMFSREAIHQLHIFIFVLAVVHVIFCATTMVLGSLKIRQWKNWEKSSTASTNAPQEGPKHHLHLFYSNRAFGYWRKIRPFGWMRSFFKQFYGSVTKSDYIALRSGFIQEHCPSVPNFNFHNYMMRTLEHDFKHMVGISWYLWLFVVIFLLLNLAGWHTYFWLSFLPLILLLLVGAHLEHIITRLAREVAERNTANDQVANVVKPSDEHFFLGRPKFILHLIHFILFQNSFEIAFFVWILASYSFHSCIMEKLTYIIPRLVMGFIVQVLCSYSTLPLYALVTQMGSQFKPGIFNEGIQNLVEDWRSGLSRKRLLSTPSLIDTSQINRMVKEPYLGVHVEEKERIVDQGTISSAIELFASGQNHEPVCPPTLSF